MVLFVFGINDMEIIFDAFVDYAWMCMANFGHHWWDDCYWDQTLLINAGTPKIWLYWNAAVEGEMCKWQQIECVCMYNIM